MNINSRYYFDRLSAIWGFKINDFPFFQGFLNKIKEIIQNLLHLRTTPEFLSERGMFKIVFLDIHVDCKVVLISFINLTHHVASDKLSKKKKTIKNILDRDSEAWHSVWWWAELPMSGGSTFTVSTGIKGRKYNKYSK